MGLDIILPTSFLHEKITGPNYAFQMARAQVVKMGES